MKGSNPAIRPMPDEVDVAVVGAGPTGLTLATMLQSFGIRTVVLEKMDEPVKHSRAAAIHARTLETLEPLGIVGEMMERGHIVPRFGVRDRSRHLLGIDFHELPTAYPYVLMLPQDETEFLICDALREQGGEIFWSCEVTGLQQEARAVNLRFSPEGNFAGFVPAMQSAVTGQTDFTGSRGYSF